MAGESMRRGARVVEGGVERWLLNADRRHLSSTMLPAEAAKGDGAAGVMRPPRNWLRHCGEGREWGWVADEASDVGQPANRARAARSKQRVKWAKDGAIKGRSEQGLK